MPAHNPHLRSLSNAILSTLALAKAEHAPVLTLADIHAYLHRCTATSPSVYELKAELKKLVGSKTVHQSGARYSLEASSAVYAESTAKIHVSARKLARAKKALAMFQAIPFLRSVSITGSVSFGSAQKTSDIDLFCATAPKRVWTARMGVLILTELLGRRRERTRGGADKLCANYFASENAEFPVQNIASAHLFARAIPMWGETSLNHLREKNRWIQQFFYQDQTHLPRTKSAHLSEESRGLLFLKAILEKLLSRTFGDVIEKICKAWQLSRLKTKTSHGGDTSQIVLTDDIITLHHPHPKNKEVMERYVRKMNELGVVEKR